MFELSEWKRMRIEADRASGPCGKGRDGMTVVAYMFVPSDRISASIESIGLCYGTPGFVGAAKLTTNRN